MPHENLPQAHRAVDVADESGSLILAMLVTIAAGGLAMTLLATTTMSQQSTRHDRDFQRAVHAAEIGLQASVQTINADDASDNTPVPVGTTHTESGSGQSATYEASSEKTADNTWHVTSTGRDGEVTRILRAVVRRPAIFHLAAFADTKMTLRGDNGVDSYDSRYGHTDTGRGALGSNGSLEMKGNAFADQITLFGPGATCTGTACTTTRTAGNNDPLRFSTELVDDGLRKCQQRDTSRAAWRASEHDTDRDGVAELTNGSNGTLCVTDLIFDRTTVVDSEAPVVVFMTGTVEVANHVTVNCPGCENESATPGAYDLQIYTSGSQVAVGNHTRAAWGLYAPNANCIGNPSNAQAELYGSLMCNDLRNQGGWNYHFDESLLDVVTETWDVAALSEESATHPS